MGTIIHHAIVATSSNEEETRRLRDEVAALTAKSGADTVSLFVTPCYTGTNGYTSFAILPDGSKLGWPTHEAHQEMRSIARGMLSGFGFRTVEVVYGETADGEPYIEGAKKPVEFP